MGREKWVETELLRTLETLESGSRPKGGVKGIIKGIPSIGAEHLSYDGGFNFKNIRFIPDKYAKNMQRGIINLEDILIVKDGATTGKTSFINYTFPYDFSCINEHVFICRVKNNLSKKFVFYYLRSHEGQEQIMATFHGGAQGGINSGFALKVKVPLPPLNEQKRIVEKLDAILPRVQNAKFRLRKIPVLLKKFRQSVLSSACSGRLTEDWREGKDLEEWYEVIIKDVSSDIKYGYTAKTIKEKKGVKYLRITDIQNKSVDWENVPFCEIPNNKYSKLKLIFGDIVIARTGATTGKSFLIKSDVKAVFASYLIRIRCNNRIISDYLYIFLQTNDYWNQISDNISGIAQPNCNATKLSRINIPLPPLEEQNEIVRRVEKLFALSDSLEAKYKKALEKIEKLEQSILSKAFRGELVESDPNDEPAVVLLQQILVEKKNFDGKKKRK